MRRHQIVAALTGALVALPLQAAPGDIPEKRLFGKYDKYQAAPQAAPAATTSTAPTKTASTPPKQTHTQKMDGQLSPGNQRIAYAIAKGALAEHGIKNPTREQIRTAMSGGTVTTKSGERVTMPGVLKLRHKGMGWGQIAQKHGFKLGEVMRHHHDERHKHAHKHDHDKRHHHKHADRHHHHGKHHHDWKHHKHERADWKHDKHERADWKHHRPDFHRTKYERPQKFERPHKHERPERPERPEKHGRSR